MFDLQDAISNFYHRWHQYESTLGRENGQILDFNMAPRGGWGTAAPFGGRMEALRALKALRRRVADEADELVNPTYMDAKLAGAEAYLRALMGERTTFEDFLFATMGIHPEPIEDEALGALRDQARAALGRAGVPFARDDSGAFQRYFGQCDLRRFEGDLRLRAQHWIRRLQDRLPRLEDPEYTIETVREDAYWSNWIDGSVEAGVKLRVNTHPRIGYVRDSPTLLAAHEIAGHAAHVSCMRAAAGRGTTDAAGLNLTVHSCEAFQMEGLAQVALHYLAEPGELNPQIELLEMLRALKGAVVNRAQIEVERGRPIDEVFEWAVSTYPLLKPLSLLSDLRDRSRGPFYRGYVHVYAPSRALFLRAIELPVERRDAFFQAAYTGLWTPAQLAALLERGSDAP